MTTAAIITLVVIVAAVVLFITEWLAIDLVAMLILLSLVLTGVISPEEGVAGFSNNATVTVAFMFVLSAALLKTGALQVLAQRLSKTFRTWPKMGLLLLMLMVAFISAFVNNTPVVAVFIPVAIQLAQSSGLHPNKLLLPVSYASIMGGMCTLIGTSTNILVSGIAEQSGLPGFSMFLLAPIGLATLLGGILYMVFFGVNIIPERTISEDLAEKFGMRDYLAEIVLLDKSKLVGHRIMDSVLVKEMEIDIIEIRRNGSRFTLPAGDFVLQAGDTLKVRCNVDKIKALKDWVKVLDKSSLSIDGDVIDGKNSTLVELVISADSAFAGKNLRELDFRRKYRAVPLAIRHREEVLHENLYRVRLKPGDIILAEVKTHYLRELRKLETEQDSPFILLSEDALVEFNRRNFAIVMAIILAVIVTATANIVPIMVGTIAGAMLLVLSRCLNVNELYEAINWRIVFLLVGALTLGEAMRNSGLDQLIANQLIEGLGQWGPMVVVSGLYLFTFVLTELMSNNATAALLAPIAIATAQQLGVSPTPFLVAVTIAASACFMTPVGYQTNAMVYSAGQYRFTDFIKVGVWLNLLAWLLASLLIPYFYKF